MELSCENDQHLSPVAPHRARLSRALRDLQQTPVFELVGTKGPRSLCEIDLSYEVEAAAENLSVIGRSRPAQSQFRFDVELPRIGPVPHRRIRAWA